LRVPNRKNEAPKARDVGIICERGDDGKEEVAEEEEGGYVVGMQKMHALVTLIY